MPFQIGHKDFRTPDGKARCAEHLRSISKLPKKRLKGKDHPNWKGDAVGYQAVHSWIKREYGRPTKCEFCKTENALRFEWSNISGEYKRDISDWQRLCTRCHANYDLEKSGKKSGYKTHCPKGHEYNESNTARHKSTGFVYCKTCNRLRGRKVKSEEHAIHSRT